MATGSMVGKLKSDQSEVGQPDAIDDPLAATIDPKEVATNDSTQAGPPVPGAAPQYGTVVCSGAALDEADDELKHSVVGVDAPPTGSLSQAAPQPAAASVPPTASVASVASTPFGSVANSMVLAPGSMSATGSVPPTAAPGPGASSTPFGSVANSMAAPPASAGLAQPVPSTASTGPPFGSVAGSSPPPPAGGPKTMLPGGPSAQRPSPFSVGAGVMPSMPAQPEMMPPDLGSAPKTMVQPAKFEPGTMIQPGLQPHVQTGSGNQVYGEGFQPIMEAESIQMFQAGGDGTATFEMSQGFQPTPQTSFYHESQPLDAQIDMKFPCINQLDHNDTWYTVGDPQMRVEPHWRQGQWWLTAPVDLAGLSKRGCAYPERMATVDMIVSESSKAGRMPQLPRPSRARNQAECPLS